MKSLKQLIVINLLMASIITNAMQTKEQARSRSVQRKKQQSSKPSRSKKTLPASLQPASEETFLESNQIQVLAKSSDESFDENIKNKSKKEIALKMAPIAEKHFDILLTKQFNPGQFGMGIELFGAEDYDTVFDLFTTVLENPLYASNSKELVYSHRKQFMRGLRFIVYHTLKAMQSFRIVRYNRLGEIRTSALFPKKGLNDYFQYLPVDQKKLLENNLGLVLNQLSTVMATFYKYTQKLNDQNITTHDLIVFAFYNGIRQQYIYLMESKIASNLDKEKYAKSLKDYNTASQRINLEENRYKLKSLAARESMADGINFIGWLVLLNFLF